ncbi:PREDICTED: ribosome production factor 2 homolog [Priapulus caudatus]|uniref:Ribosome production factor 2 homolog n=1 Tax=Priapulus caudatus TaxID=37621 RepID=A0ABM1EC07_PRICU|nr:PREDICTED: ribosome production factor 2 homolog [Priapulus caudatus]
MLIRGGNTSEQVTNSMKDLYALKKPNAVMYKRKNIVRPFDDESSLEFFSEKSDASLFVFGSHSKKRPHNLTIGRMYDMHVLDMVELGIEKFQPLSSFAVAKCPTGTKPCLVFTGEPFEHDHEYKRLKNMFIDLFRGPVVENIRLAGLEHVIMFAAVDGKILLRSYKILLKKSGTRTPRIELEEMGPSFDFALRRTKLASDDLFKLARKQPKEIKIKKTKNVSQDAFGTKLGRIHMEKQDLSELQTRKMRGLKRQKPERNASKISSDNKKAKFKSEEN